MNPILVKEKLKGSRRTQRELLKALQAAGFPTLHLTTLNRVLTGAYTGGNSNTVLEVADKIIAGWENKTPAS